MGQNAGLISSTISQGIRAQVPKPETQTPAPKRKWKVTGPTTQSLLSVPRRRTSLRRRGPRETERERELGALRGVMRRVDVPCCDSRATDVEHVGLVLCHFVSFLIRAPPRQNQCRQIANSD